VGVGTEVSMPGFTEFLYKRVIPACFNAPIKPTFDLSDAQTIQVATGVVLVVCTAPLGGSLAEWVACWTQVQ